MASDKNIIRASGGSPWINNQTSKSAGERGPLLLENWQLIEKLAHQNRERIPERTVHAKGSGAYGTLTVTKDVTDITSADLFSEVGKKTDFFIRFSTVAGEMGAADAERDVRGWAMKFYTQDGNWDLVGNNTPVFFIRDPMKFPDFIHTQKRNPRTNMRSSTAAWDFWSLHPESLHQVAILFSDRGIPQGYRFMDGFGSHTYSFYNRDNRRVWVKFHFKTEQGHRYYTNEEAAKVVGRNRESSQQDLYDALERKEFPRWRFYVQVMTEEQARTVSFNPFDVTKVWRHADFPLREVGYIELNKNPENYFAEVEQASFSPSNIVPGIGFSPDKMLQGRIFAYADAHRYRVGTHYEMLPVNRPRIEVKNYHKDGRMRFDIPASGMGDYYQPNSFGGPVDSPELADPGLALHGDTGYFDQHIEPDDFEQPRLLFRLFDADQKKRFFGNIADSMEGVPEFIIERQLALFAKADEAWAQGVRDELEARRA